MGIKADLTTGKRGEKIAAVILNRGGFAVGWNNDKNIRQDFDLCAAIEIEKVLTEFTLEVKYDIYSEKSGNLAVEFHNSKQNKPSGIDATKADFWVFVTPTKGTWITKVETLKDYINNNTPVRTIEAGGDKNSNMYLYKMEKILRAIFTRIDELKPAEIKATILNMLDFGV